MSSQQPPTSARLLIVESRPDLRGGFLSALPGLPYEIGVAHDGAEAVAMVRRQEYDVVLTDTDVPTLSGLDILSLVKELSPRTEVILFTGNGTLEEALRALRGGAFDFLLKPVADTKTLLLTIERALNRRYRPEAGTERVAPPADAGVALSPRELEVMRLVGEGLENRAIAERLEVSARTVGNHLSAVYEKLGVSNRTQATVRCRALGLL